MPRMSRKKLKEIKRERSIIVQKRVEAENRIRESQCGNKKRYDTEFEAYNAGKYAFKDGRHIGTYFCDYCRKWHITTKEVFIRLDK